MFHLSLLDSSIMYLDAYGNCFFQAAVVNKLQAEKLFRVRRDVASRTG
jgi:hypothetical protein